MVATNSAFEYFPLIASFSAMIISQSIKLILMLLKSKEVKWSSLSRSGGMPSSHSALITGMSLSLALKEGVNSSYFYIAIIMSFIVIYDARGIRHAVGKHARVINTKILSTDHKKLNESVGHTLPEIVVGICLGTIVTLTVYKMLTF